MTHPWGVILQEWPPRLHVCECSHPILGTDTHHRVCRDHFENLPQHPGLHPFMPPPPPPKPFKGAAHRSTLPCAMQRAACLPLPGDPDPRNTVRTPPLWAQGVRRHAPQRRTGCGIEARMESAGASGEILPGPNAEAESQLAPAAALTLSRDTRLPHVASPRGNGGQSANFSEGSLGHSRRKELNSC